MKIIFVDDDANVLKSLKRQMVLADIDAETFFSAETALVYLLQQKVDIVVSDLLMPGMDGVDFLEQVQKLYPETFRVVLTGTNSKNKRIQQAYENRTIEQWFIKPCNIKELLSYFKRIESHEQYSTV